MYILVHALIHIIHNSFYVNSSKLSQSRIMSANTQAHPKIHLVSLLVLICDVDFSRVKELRDVYQNKHTDSNYCL